MNKLEELIKEFCPNGVEHVKLCDVADFRAGSSFPEREQGKKAGRYPFYKVVDMNKTQIYMEKANNYINEETCTKLKCKPAPKGTIIFPKVGATMGTNKKRILSIEACYDNNIMGLFAKNIDPKFLYYCFSKVDLLSLANGKGAVPSLDTEKMARIQIPLPALPVQREIVRILDSFTLYSAELTAELTARRKQYEFYRDKLLNFNSTKIEWKTLKETCDIVDYRGKTPQKVDKGIFLVTAKNIKKGYIDYETSKEYVAKEDYVEVMHRGIPEIGDVIFTTEAPCGNVAQIDNRNVALAQRVIKYRPKNNKLNSTFLKYYLLSKNFQSVLHTKTTGGTVEGIKGSVLHQLLIPVPPIDVQERIVKVLDNFDAICSDLGIGLPAEIEKRQKQYEYYRDKLLNFKDIEEDGEKETKAKGTGKN